MPLHSLMFGWEYPPLHSGGLGVACQGLVRGLLQNGIGVTLVLPMEGTSEESVRTLHPTGPLPDIRIVQSNLQPYEGPADYVRRLAASGGIGPDKGPLRGKPDDLYGPDLEAAVERYTAQSVMLTRDVRADVTHCHDWMTFEAGMHASKHHDIPLITHVHATELDRTDFQPNTWISRIERLGMLAADKVIAVSRYTKSMLVDHYGIPADKISVVHNGHTVTAASRQPKAAPQAGKQKDPLILFLGRLTVQKNPWQFLEVAKHIHDVRPEAKFVMAGDGPMLGELMERACALGIGDSVLFTGKVPTTDISALYRKADCFVMPSLSEPFGLVALEAIAHGVPVVLSKQSGAAEVIEHAFKVDFWDTEKMADCILTILREAPLSRQLSNEAPHILQKLTWGNQANMVRSVYENLLRDFAR